MLVRVVLQNTEGVKYYRKPFQFLSLGIMAYVGNDRALTQVNTQPQDKAVLLVACITVCCSWLRAFISEQAWQ